MPSECLKWDSGEYLVHHNPMAYYTNLGTDCHNYDVPFGPSPDLSAPFTLVTPNGSTGWSMGRSPKATRSSRAMSRR